MDKTVAVRCVVKCWPPCDQCKQAHHCPSYFGGKLYSSALRRSSFVLCFLFTSSLQFLFLSGDMKNRRREKQNNKVRTEATDAMVWAVSTKIPLTEFLQLGRPFTWALFSPHADIISCVAVSVAAVRPLKAFCADGTATADDEDAVSCCRSTTNTNLVFWRESHQTKPEEFYWKSARCSSPK